jgi:spore germination cell wall hydrolase CwlJ-like protein
MAHRVFPALGLVVFLAIPGAEEPLPEMARPRELTDADRAIAAEVEADARLLSQLALAEDPRAVAAVVWVVLNRGGCRVGPLRCRRPVLAVVTSGRAFGTVQAGRWRASWDLDGATVARVDEEVRAVLVGARPDPTGGATHFHRVGTWVPPWAPAPARWRVLGSHAFYKESRPAGTKKKSRLNRRK